MAIVGLGEVRSERDRDNVSEFLVILFRSVQLRSPNFLLHIDMKRNGGANPSADGLFLESNRIESIDSRI